LPGRLKVRNVGGGDLNARIASAPAWIDAQLTGDTLILKAEPKAPGNLLGDVVIDSNGGSATIRVIVQVHPLTPAEPRDSQPQAAAAAPKLALSSSAVDFWARPGRQHAKTHSNQGA
jgi:hypothetical protein